MATIFWSVPSTPRPPAQTNPWTSVQMVWTGTDGTSWDLSRWQNGVLLLAGTRGLSRIDSTRFLSESAGTHGSRFRGQRFPEREVFWPVSVAQGDGTQAWLDFDRAFWASLNPRGTGVWRVTQPDGTWRELTCRPVGDGGHTWEKAPGLRYWTNYGVYLVAEDPFWYGPEIKSPLWTSAAPVDFIDVSGTSTTYAWSGTPGASTSTETVDGVVVRENLSTEPSAEYGVTGWGGGGAVTADTSRAWAGSSSFRLDQSGGPAYRTECTADAAGETYTYSAYVWVGAGDSATLRVGGSAVSAANYMTATGSDTWQRVHGTVTTTGAGNITVYPAYQAAGITWVDGVLVEKIDTPGPYFDGDTPDEIVGGPPYHPGSATTIDTASLTNPGDEDAWPLWTVTGPVDSVQVTLDGQSIGYGELIEGDVLVIDTENRRATLNGEVVTGQLSTFNFAPIPPGGTVPLDIVMTGGGTLQASFRPRHDRAW